jgi:hypothetical protein
VHDMIDAVTDSAKKLCRHDETAKQSNTSTSETRTSCNRSLRIPT